MHRLPKAVILHEGDARDAVTLGHQVREGGRAHRQRDQPVRQTRRLVQLDRGPRREGLRQLRRSHGLYAPDPRGAARRREPGHDPGDQPSAADGHHDRFDVREIFDDFEGDGGLTRDDVGVIEGRDHGEMLLRHQRFGLCVAVGGGPPREDDLPTPFLHAFDLHRGRGFRHHDHGAHAEPVGGPGDGLSVISRRVRDDAAVPVRLGEAAHRGECAAGLEGPHGLQAFELEVDLERLDPDQGSPDRHAIEPARGFSNPFGGHHHVFLPLGLTLGASVALGASLPFGAGVSGSSSPSSPASPAASSSFTTRATSTTRSPAVRFITFTPCVLRPEIRMPSTGTRMMIPFLVINIISSSGRTSFSAMMSPVLSVCLRVMMPRPPRCWTRYSSSSERLPMPFSVMAKSVEARRTITMSMTWSFLSSSMPFTPVAARPMSRTSCSWNRMLMPWPVASTTSFRPSVTCTSISSSPLSMLMARIPAVRGFPNSESTVFLTMPFLVAKSRN